MTNITKNIFLNTLACPSLGWLLRTNTVSRQDDYATRFRLEQGIKIGEMARDLYGSGLLIKELKISDAVNHTKKAIQRKERALFEAAFQYENFISRVDILINNSQKLQMYEVKSSLNDKPEYIDDMAYTVLIAKLSGYNIEKISLLLLSRDYRLGQPVLTMFNEIEHTDAVLSKVSEFESCLEFVQQCCFADKKPDVTLKFECKKCNEFEDCFGDSISHHIFDLPRLSKPKFDQLKDMNILSISDIPTAFPLTANQEIIRNSVQSNKNHINKDLPFLMEEVIWPAYYLDFETVMTAIPLYPDIAPHSQLLTQYSIHKCDSFDEVIEHYEFLAEPSKDSRRELAKKLISDLGDYGSIIVYSHFEKTQLSGLMNIFPEYKTQLQEIIDRLVDLEAIIRKGFYHPDFHGSTSIKKTLPALVPEMSYDGMAISNGNNAMAAFAMMAQKQVDTNEMQAIKENLLKYCKQDTYAMVKLHCKLFEFLE
ncbi:MAG: DUF2779 domain-containing protein [Proteobacteria bacterium]|nr:DUF2779 domain-containing protein [bacterium]MBU4130423.1 DUF2779 domain-containing protein [Pseudomonadota bacterium]